MKKTLYCLLAVFVLNSCEKGNDPNPGTTNGPQLKKFHRMDGANQLAWVFNYDSNGRMVGQSWVESGVSTPISTISYNGNEAVIIKSLISPDVVEDTEIRITLDNEGKALKRIQRTFMEFKGSIIPQ